MVFDKTKAMRNAERHLAQGKIRLAINEYKQVVDNDPKDFVTMNLLGDLYTKADEPRSAVTYYAAVADHYSKQGFSQKAIAVYNKISKLQPNSVGVSEKLAELYKTKGSVKEAKSHYVLLAESYQAKGRMNEALAMWKQIAMLDPNNTEVYITIGDMCIKGGLTADAVEAFSEGAARFLRAGLMTSSVETYARAVELDRSNERALRGFVEASFAAGSGDGAVEKLRSMLEEDRGNRELINVLVDCYLGQGNAAEAERAVTKLVELEPANYPKLLDLAHHYISSDEFESASRMLSMASEHLIAGGKAEAFATAVRAVLVHRPDQLEALRLLVRFCTWQRDEAALKDALQQLARVSKDENSVDDERFALSHLAMLMPQDAGLAERLRSLNAEHGFEDDHVSGKGLFDERFFKANGNGNGNGNGYTADVPADVPAFEISSGADFAIVGSVIGTADGGLEVQAMPTAADMEVVTAVEHSAAVEVVEEQNDDSPEARLKRESESIRFYIDNGYRELAEKAIEELRAEFGNVPDVAELVAHLGGPEPVVEEAAIEQPVSVETVEISEKEEIAEKQDVSNLFDIDDLRSELGLEEPDPIDDTDYDTKYQTAIAYQEMGLLEQAIAEFQDAASLVRPNDGSRRFFHCANLLGHCFMQNGMPKLAAKWYERALEIHDLSSDEKQALWYEMGTACEAESDFDGAERYFEQVYAENVDYRDVRARLKNMMVAQ